MPTIVRAEKVTKIYPVGEIQVAALRGVTLAVEAGEFVSIVGASGSGKSTLLHILGGLTQPTRGRVFIEGTEYGTLSDGQRTALRRRSIGIVFQKFNLLPTLDAAANIAIAREIAGAPAIPDGYEQHLVQLLGIGERLHHRPTQLSGGEQQRVAIARALINQPRILLADEPTGNLDSVNSEAVLGVLLELNRTLGQTILMITHNAAAASIGNRVLHMRDGLMVED
ncbi:MAG: ABC transporter ATP-binding protein [Acidobacteria bacterium]|nr:MAG: ABC transporter ATP-binding protein [Acidobacteriota bacterium]